MSEYLRIIPCLLFLAIAACVKMDQPDKVADYTKRVNVFLGTDKSDPSNGLQLADNLPRIDTSWFNVREIYGATHPGATQPFGMVSVNAMGREQYKTGYPTGYNGQDFYGLSHFHASGTGTIRWYYNYFLFTPQIGALNFQKKKQKINAETASPACYSCTLESGIQAEKQFQGLNNEVDYTVPYAYLYAGRPDRTQQITRVAMAYRFHNTHGGLPGNDDSGAMTSWYVWNALGLFPLAGQDILLIGSPTFKTVTLNLQAGPFIITTNNNSPNNIYIQSATLNGEVLDRTFLYFRELSGGGELIFEMGSQPSAWGSNSRPPVYSLQ